MELGSVVVDVTREKKVKKEKERSDVSFSLLILDQYKTVKGRILKGDHG